MTLRNFSLATGMTDDEFQLQVEKMEPLNKAMTDAASEVDLKVVLGFPIDPPQDGGGDGNLSTCSFHSNTVILSDGGVEKAQEEIRFVVEEAKRSLVGNGLSRLAAAKLMWLNVFDSNLNPLGDKGVFSLQLFAYRP